METTGWIALAAAIVLVITVAKVVHARARQAHLERLWAAVTAPPDLPADTSPHTDDHPEREVEPPLLEGVGLDAEAAAAVPAANAVWQWTQIDPQFVQSVDFSHTAEVDSHLDLMNLLADRYTDLEGASHTGAVSRLKGYLFEEQAHEHLQELHGSSVTRPDASNNPGYDFEVAEEQIDPKATDQLSNVDT